MTRDDLLLTVGRDVTLMRNENGRQTGFSCRVKDVGNTYVFVLQSNRPNADRWEGFKAFPIESIAEARWIEEVHRVIPIGGTAYTPGTGPRED